MKEGRLNAMIPHSRPWLGPLERQAINHVLESGMLVDGRERRKFQFALESLTGSSCALFSSGRQALLAALRSLNLPAASHVIVQTYACEAVVWAIRSADLIPRFCDITDSWVTSPSQVGAVFDERCKALILAPPFGIAQSANHFRKFEIPIISDFAQTSPAILSEMGRDGLGEITILSFHPTKYLCAGGLGAALTRDENLAEKLRTIDSTIEPIAHVTELQAALGSIQLSRLNEIESRRQHIFELYCRSAPEKSLRTLKSIRDPSYARWMRFPLRVQGNLAGHFERLASEGIIARCGVDQLAHRLSGLEDAKFPNAVNALSTTLSVPFYPALSDVDVGRIARAIVDLE